MLYKHWKIVFLNTRIRLFLLKLYFNNMTVICLSAFRMFLLYAFWKISFFGYSKLLRGFQTTCLLLSTVFFFSFQIFFTRYFPLGYVSGTVFVVSRGGSHGLCSVIHPPHRPPLPIRSRTLRKWKATNKGLFTRNNDETVPWPFQNLAGRDFYSHWTVFHPSLVSTFEGLRWRFFRRINSRWLHWFSTKKTKKM